MSRLRNRLLLLGVPAAACGGGSAGGSTTAGTRTVAGVTCVRGISRPVPTRALVASLHAHGVDARRDGYCSSPDAVAQVSNVSLPVPTVGKQGPLLAVLNVSCNVYPVGKQAEAQIQRVVAG